MTKTSKQILILLSMAQVILTLDSTVMNVSITALVKDLNTTVAGVQSAITFYTLVMAAFMIAGAKVGDIIGRKKAFVVGLVIYGVGSGITAISTNLSMLMLGWSLLEGLGAALIIPSMISLIASNFAAGKERIAAYGTTAAMAAIGAGVGPIIGGILTTYATWRLAFAGEVIIVAYILMRRALIVDAKLVGVKPKLDYVGVLLSASGLAIVVKGILMASEYGFIKARKAFVWGGQEILSAGGLSPTVYLVGIGLAVLLAFGLWELRRQHTGKDVLVHLKLFKEKIVASGVSLIFAQQFLLAGVLYSIALYLQIELQLNAFKTGMAMLPLSLMVLVAASRGSVIATKFSPKRIVQAGFTLMVLGSIWLGVKSGSTDSARDLIVSLGLIGAGVGIVVSQLQNLVQSAVSAKESAEASGLMATFQYLGASFGTALSGVILIGVLVNSSSALINDNTTLNPQQKAQLEQAYNTQAQIVSDAQIKETLKGQPPQITEAVVDINAQARSQALSWVFVLLGLMSAFGLLATLGLPGEKPRQTAAAA